MSLENDFQNAQVKVKTLSAQSNDSLLKLYALFKQATLGDAGGKKPGLFDLVGKAKYDAWETLKGKGKDQAMKEYVAFVDELAKQEGK